MSEDVSLLEEEAEILTDTIEHINFAIIVNRNNLLKSLSHVQSVVEKKNIISIISNIKFEAQGEELILTATDMDITIVEKINAKIDSTGCLTIPAHTIYEIVKKLPENAEIKLATNVDYPGRLIVRCGKSRFTLPFLSAEQFPNMDYGEALVKIEISNNELKSMLDKTRFAVSNEETRYNLNGIFLHTVKEQEKTLLKVVATDGHRLSLSSMELKEEIELSGVIIPKKTVVEIRKILESSAGMFELIISNNKISFINDSIVVISKLIEGSFPDYNAHIPYSNEKSIIVNTSLFIKAVDRVSTIMNFEKFRSVKFSLSNNKLCISSTGEGTGEDEVEALYEGEDLEMNFNARYLLDVANTIDGDEIEFLFNNIFSPMIVKDRCDDNSLHVIMPMRI